jgi:hypothetical protein
MMFVSNLAAGRLRYTGDITVGGYSGYMSDRYVRAIYTYPQPFAKIPIVLVASKNGDGTSDQGGLTLNAIANGFGRLLPMYTVEIYRDRFELYVLRYRVASNAPWIGSGADSWRFWVLSNPIN